MVRIAAICVGGWKRWFFDLSGVYIGVFKIRAFCVSFIFRKLKKILLIFFRF